MTPPPKKRCKRSAGVFRVLAQLREPEAPETGHVEGKALACTLSHYCDCGSNLYDREDTVLHKHVQALAPSLPQDAINRGFF